MNQAENPTPSERNSSLRKLVDGPLEKLLAPAVAAHQEITPNHITAAGVAVTGLSTELEVYSRNLDESQRAPFSTAAKVLHIAGLLFDKFDGNWARERARQGLEHDAVLGEKVDTLADRISELWTSISHIRLAHQRGDVLGMIAAALAGSVNNLTSLTRAMAAAEGKEVPETGGSAGKILGTRLGRAVTGGVGTFFPEVKLPVSGREQSIPLQTVLDLLSVVTTISTALSRFQIAHDPETPVTLSSQQQQNARERLKLLKTTAFLSVLGSGAVFLLLRQKNRGR